MEMRVDLGRKAKTSEHRNEAGEYGPETKMTRDGRVMLLRGVPVVIGAAAQQDGAASFRPGVSPLGAPRRAS